MKYFWSLTRGMVTGGPAAFYIAGGELNRLFLLFLAFLYPFWFLLMSHEIIKDENKYNKNLRVIFFVTGFILAFLLGFIIVKFGK